MDNASLAWLLRFRNAEGQLARWLEELGQYDMTILHRSGRKHTNADGLSRIPDRLPQCNCYEEGKEIKTLPCGGCSFCQRCQLQWERFELDVDDVVPIAVRRVCPVTVVPMEEEEFSPEVTEVDSYKPEELRERQLADPDLEPLLTWLHQGEPTEAELFLKSPAVKHLWKCKSQLRLRNGVLYYQWDYGTHTSLKLVIPASMTQEILSMMHDTKVGGHFGRDKTLERAKRSVFWSGMSMDVKLFVATCRICSTNKKLCKSPRAELQNYQAGARLERVHLDFLGPFLESDNGNKYILMIVDQFTKWVSCIPLPDQNAKRMALAFYEHFVCFFGCPLQIHTDQGRNFDGNYFQALCDLLQVVKTRTTPYRPSSNGQVERYNRVVLQFVRCFIDGKQRDWDKYIASVAMSIRATVNKSTGFTPNFLMFGQELNMPADILLGVAAANSQANSPSEHSKELAKILQEAYRIVRENLEGVQLRQKKLYDVKMFQRSFQKGDLVYKLNSATKVGQSRKLSPVFTGPYLVMEVLSSALYRVEDRKRSWVVHHDKLIICQDRSVPLWMRTKRHKLMDPAEVDQELVNGDLEGEEGLDGTLIEEEVVGSMEGTVLTEVPGKVVALELGTVLTDVPEKEAVGSMEGTVLTEVPEKKIVDMKLGTVLTEVPEKGVVDMELGTVLTEVPEKGVVNMELGTVLTDVPEKGVVDSELGTVLTEVPEVVQVDTQGDKEEGIAALGRTRSGRQVKPPVHLGAYEMY